MKLFKLATLAALLFSQNFTFAADPEPYTAVRNLTQTPYFFENGFILLDLVNSRAATVVIDVDSVDGAAARYIAQNAPSSLLKVYSIQNWSNSDRFKNPYQQFLSNVKQENTANLIIPVRMESLEAATALSLQAEVIFINTIFKDNVYDDILAWSTHLTSNGIIAGNNWNDAEVINAVTQAANSLNLVLKINGNFWWLERS